MLADWVIRKGRADWTKQTYNHIVVNTMCAYKTWYLPITVNTSRSFPHSWLITGFVNRLTRRVSPVEQELFTFPEHLSSPPLFNGVRVTRSLVLYVCFVDLRLSFCTFSFSHCVFCSSLINGFWLPLWYLQTLLVTDTSSQIVAIYPYVKKI